MAIKLSKNHLSPHRKGFTLIELLTVIVIILILLGIGASIGPGVIGTSNKAATEATMTALYQIAEEYRILLGSYPSADPSVLALNQQQQQASADGENKPSTTENFIDDIQATGLSSMLSNFSDTTIVSKQSIVVGFPWEDTQASRATRVQESDLASHTWPTALDAWSQPIIYKSKHILGGAIGAATNTSNFLPKGAIFSSGGPNGLIGFFDTATITSKAYIVTQDNIYVQSDGSTQ